MMYYSTKNKKHLVNGRQAVLSGLAPDGGLYMPEAIPQLPQRFFDQLRGKSLQEIAYIIASVFLGEDVPSEKLHEITSGALNFEIPLMQVGDAHVLELFHGPTLAFKDVGARFMARLMSHFVQGESRELTILVATSGDTGSAVANGFHNVPGIRVIVLYPSGKVSELQERQMTTLGGNITALEVDGVFDDCQALVKQAFVDSELSQALWLSSANSINIARLIPQTFYYFWALAQLPEGEPRVVTVPSGNFGNLTAGLMAKRMGLPVDRFIAATNVNDVVPEYLTSGDYRPRPSVPTISNAMDVGAPSNFDRMLDLYGGDVQAMREDVVGIMVSEQQTRETIARVHRDHGYILDPHGAVAYNACERSVKRGVVIETAHPAKFGDTVESQIGKPVEIPKRLAACMDRPKQASPMANDFQTFKGWLLGL
jgi:threonine synthase